MRVLSFDMGTKNLAFAVVEAPTRILRMGCIDLGTNAARDSAEVLLDSLHAENAWMFECCDEIVVESQPVNGACKTLSFVLMTCFRMWDELRQRHPIRPFRFMAAGFKLKYNPTLMQQRPPESYADRKEIAIAMVYPIFQENSPEMLEFFRGQTPKRKTDLADAIVQACQHVKSPDADSKKYRKLTNGRTIDGSEAVSEDV